MRWAYSARCSGETSSRSSSRANPSTMASELRRSWTSRRSSSSVIPRPAALGARGRSVLELDLAALQRDRDGVDPVAGLELADHVAHMGAHRLDRDGDLAAD